MLTGIPDREGEGTAPGGRGQEEAALEFLLGGGGGRDQSEAALSMEGDGEEGDGDELAVGEDPLAFLRSQPQFQQMRQVFILKLENKTFNLSTFCSLIQVVQQNPALLNAILQQIGQTNPALLQLISQHQDAFFRMLTEPAGSAPATAASTGAPGSGARSGQGQGLESPQEGQEGVGGYFSPGVIHVTPQDKEAIERVSSLITQRSVIRVFFCCWYY